MQGYKPIRLVLDEMKEMELKPAIYPPSKILYLSAIQERVPVFEGMFRISQDVKVSSTAEFWGSLGKEGRTFTISGTLEYQACDKRICYLPASVAVKWQVQVFPSGSHSRTRRNPSQIGGSVETSMNH